MWWSSHCVLRSPRGSRQWHGGLLYSHPLSICREVYIIEYRKFFSLKISFQKPIKIFFKFVYFTGRNWYSLKFKKVKIRGNDSCVWEDCVVSCVCYRCNWNGKCQPECERCVKYDRGMRYCDK